MSEELKNTLSDEELQNVAGGNDGMGRRGIVRLPKGGYLAVRNSPRAGSDNQIGGLLEGWPVTVLEYPAQNGYIKVKARCYATTWTQDTGVQIGWVNKDNIVILG